MAHLPGREGTVSLRPRHVMTVRHGRLTPASLTHASLTHGPCRERDRAAEGLASRRSEGLVNARQRPARRQLEVLRAYATTGSIAAADELGISETTVRQHLSGLYRRTGCLNA